MICMTELEKLERDLVIEKIAWRRNGKGIHFDNIQSLREKIDKLKKENENN